MRKDSDKIGRYGAELSTWSASSEGPNLPLAYPAGVQKSRLISDHIGRFWIYSPEKRDNFAPSTHIYEAEPQT